MDVTLTVDLHLQILDDLRVEYKKIAIELPFEFGNLEDDNYNMKILKERIKNVNGWNRFSLAKKKDIILLVIKPYKMKNEILEDLINNS